MPRKLYSDMHDKSTIILKRKYGGSGNWLYHDYLYEKLEKYLNDNTEAKAENMRKLRERISFLLSSALWRPEYDVILSQVDFTKEDFQE